MISRFLNLLRCFIALRLLKMTWHKKYFLANLICPDTQTLVARGKKRNTTIPRPRFSHIFYHQASVDLACAENALDTFLDQISIEDEIIIYDKGGLLPHSWLERLRPFRWHSWVSHLESLSEMASYTYGMNDSMARAQGEVLCLWRSDYIFPPNLQAQYQALIPKYDMVLPYSVTIANATTDGSFIRQHWDHVRPYNTNFWNKQKSESYSLYEAEDPVLFAIRRETWNLLGGLNHDLWGYGWQFAEFAGRMRSVLGRHRIRYVDVPPPVHQYHSSSLMVRDQGWSEHKSREEAEGKNRFARFLGGPAQLECYDYRWQQRLHPLPVEERRQAP
ncbi:MAG: hypothetical protein HC904_13485 [Blastochloris sp.]|nr:hypothetical protein [Blastochloris sp.]